MAQSERNPQDNRYDPFTHMMFGSYLPPAGPPPQESYQTGESYTSERQIKVSLLLGLCSTS
ncbi:hypothetical protein QS257_15185 [Terrilactibacillus sp. S3-3]|nr:hypothetical protein QS257_15185 [Terrilactibacillus sp. S3-3]